MSRLMCHAEISAGGGHIQFYHYLSPYTASRPRGQFLAGSRVKQETDNLSEIRTSNSKIVKID